MRWISSVWIALVVFCQSLLAAPGSHAADLTELSLEDLMNVEITSVSKQAERLSDTAAAVFVITADDIRRSGVTSIPEALRMVPGVQVGRIDASKWAITARGFNGRFANKLLVLIDGRSVYTPLFSGVYWDVQDTLELSLVGQNLIEGRHLEAVPEGGFGGLPTEVEQRVYGKVTWQL
jgi:iron complex outermembrane receptor protein